MSNIDMIRLFEKSIFLSKGTRFQKIRKNPKKIFCLKFLKLITDRLISSIRIKAKTFWNDEMLIIIPEQVSLSIYRYGFFEEGLTGMILKYLKPGMTFFDIGAHFGYFTLLSSVIVGNQGKIHSFEPTPSSFNILKANVSSRGNVISNNCAVLSKRKAIFMNDYGIKYSAFNSVYDFKLSKHILSKTKVKKYKIESISIDDYVENNGVIPNFIKVDAEGSEYEVLIGMEKTINKIKPIISIEVGDVDLAGVPTSKNVIKFLINKGYQPYEYKEGKILKHALKNDPYRYGNILFLPS